MKRVPLAVIDVGSNTIRSLIVQPLPDRSYRILDDEREPVRLASGLTRQGRLSTSAIARGVKVLKRMAEIVRGRGVRRVEVVATSAIRTASNQREFIDRVRSETGLRVRVISGAEEARLAFESAARSFDLAEFPCAVADVGGGSTEVILGVGNHMQRDYSLSLGTVALTEEFLHSDPVKRREFKAMRKRIQRELEAAKIARAPRPQFLIASGGTATSIAQMVMARQGLDGRPVQGFEMTQAELLHLRQALLRRTLAELRETPGLSPDRADLIIAGVAILYEVLGHLKANVLRVSTRGIRHALLNRLITRRSALVTAPLVRRRRLASAEALLRSLRVEPQHGEHVRDIALSIFDQCAESLGIEAGARDLLAAAALLHDVGYVVGFRQHHKHSYHLIAHAQLDGFTPHEREIIAQVARYHRRSGPKKRHAAWAALSHEYRELVARLSAILRIADALDRRHSQGVRVVRCRVTRRRIHVAIRAGTGLGVELHAAQSKTGLFRKVFRRIVKIEMVRSGPPVRPVSARVSRAAP